MRLNNIGTCRVPETADINDRDAWSEYKHNDQGKTRWVRGVTNESLKVTMFTFVTPDARFVYIILILVRIWK